MFGFSGPELQKTQRSWPENRAKQASSCMRSNCSGDSQPAHRQQPPALHPRLHSPAHPLPCRAKQHLPFLQRAGKVSAVCEYVLSGHRVKVGSSAAAHM